MNVESERKRFNRLSQKDAKALLKEMDGKETALRSCWYCNGAHEHLKKADYPFNCVWGCGIWYLRGFPVPIVARRAKGQEIDKKTMKEFVAALQNNLSGD